MRYVSWNSSAGSVRHDEGSIFPDSHNRNFDHSMMPGNQPGGVLPIPLNLTLPWVQVSNSSPWFGVHRRLPHFQELFLHKTDVTRKIKVQNNRDVICHCWTDDYSTLEKQAAGSATRRVLRLHGVSPHNQTFKMLETFKILHRLLHLPKLILHKNDTRNYQRPEEACNRPLHAETPAAAAKLGVHSHFRL